MGTIEAVGRACIGAISNSERCNRQITLPIPPQPVRMIIYLICAFTIASNTMIGPALAADTPPYVQISLALMTGLLGFIGSWIGAQVALGNFRKQRAFDKQLDWYERAVTAIHAMAEKIIIAVNYEDEQRSSKVLAAQWREVQLAHRAIDRVAQEAPLYATDNALAVIAEIQKKVQDVADKTTAFDPPKFPEGADKYKLLKKIYALGEFLEGASPPLLREGRLHLGIGRTNFWQRISGRSNALAAPVSDPPAKVRKNDGSA